MRNWMNENWWDVLNYVVVFPAMIASFLWSELPGWVYTFAYIAPAFLLSALLPLLLVLASISFYDILRGGLDTVPEPDSVLRWSSVGVWLIFAAAIGHPVLAGLSGGLYILHQVTGHVAHNLD